MELPHGPQRFDLMSGVFAVLQTLVAHGSLTLDAVHTQVLQLVLGAGGDLPGARAAADSALRRRHEPVFGQRTPGRVAPEAAWVAVEHVALLAHDRRLAGTLLAQLTLERGRFALLVPVHHSLEHAVLGEAPEPPVVQRQAAVALRAGEAGVPRDRRQDACVRQQVVLCLGRRRHGRGENSHSVGGLLARGGRCAHEPAVRAVSAVRLAVQAHLIQV